MYCSQECRLRDHHNQLPPSLHIHQQFSRGTTTSRSSTASPSPNQSPNFSPYGSSAASSTTTVDFFSSRKPSPSSPHRSNSMTNRRMSAWYGGTLTPPGSQQLLSPTMTVALPQQQLQFTYELHLCKCKSPTCKHKQTASTIPTHSERFYESRSRACTLGD